ncbi:hypothetical protein AALA56_04620 [Streptococcus hyointestinalis]|uniref:hypothetical protein n=1 Tax=Streptococcus hyointestinalis TaxID=1337 RepID=UPI003511837C
MNISIDDIIWLLNHATSYAISKHCGLSTQAVDKYKHGTADIMNMRLKHGLAMTKFAKELKQNNN